MAIKMTEANGVKALYKVSNDVECTALEMALNICEDRGYDGLLYAHGYDVDGRWVCDIADDGYLRTVQHMVNQLLKMGCRRVALLVCNPGEHDVEGAAWYDYGITNVGCMRALA